MKHLIVIPTYNEAENIEDMISAIFDLYPQVSILVVDDSSPDGTADIVSNLKDKYQNLYLISQEKKLGLANAYINGFKWGLNEGFDLFTSIDADFSHKPKYINEAIKLINDGYDVACGARYGAEGGTTEKHWFRNLTSIGGNIYARLVLGKNLYDWTEGFNTYKKEVFEKINLDTISVKGYIFQAQMKYKTIQNGFKIVEFPILFEERKKGKSKMSAFIILEALISVFKIRLDK